MKTLQHIAVEQLIKSNIDIRQYIPPSWNDIYFKSVKPYRYNYGNCPDDHEMIENVAMDHDLYMTVLDIKPQKGLLLAARYGFMDGILYFESAHVGEKIVNST